MTVHDDVLIERIRTTLQAWAEEVPQGQHGTLPLSGRPDEHPAAWRRRGVRVGLAAAAIALVVAGGIALSRSRERVEPVHVGPGRPAVTEIPFGRHYGIRGLAVTDDAVWVTSQADAELYRIDPATDQVVATYPIPSHVEGVLPAGGSLWLSRYDPYELVRVDPATGAVTASLAFDSQPALAATADALWVIADGPDGTGIAFRLDPASAKVTTQIALDAPPGFATIDADSLWVAHAGTTTVSRVDLAQGRVADVVDVGGEPRDGVAAGGAMWVGVNGPGIERAGSVVRIDPDTAEVTATIPTGRDIDAIAANGDEVWVTNRRDGTVSIIDARTAELVITTPMGGYPGGLAAGHGSMWVTPHRDLVLLRLDGRPIEPAAKADIAQALTVSSGTVYLRCSGSGSPTVVLEADAFMGSAAWAPVEAGLARTTRVCSYDRVGIADPEEAGNAGPAATMASDLFDALGQVDERGPFVMVGEGLGALTARMFTADHRDRVVGLVLVNGTTADSYDRLRPLLPPAAREKLDLSLREDPELRFAKESSAQVAATAATFGDLPLVVVADGPIDPVVWAKGSDPPLTVAEVEAIAEVRVAIQREQATLSSGGRLIIAEASTGLGLSRDTPAVVVDAVRSLVEGAR